jgi:glucosyl-dolichyl phosphate glucuronosyltransferase
MKISVVLCTYNRCQSLRQVLNNLATLTLPESVQWEVVVVDNNSRDETRQVVEDLYRTHPGCFRYVFEPQPGLSHARNAGIWEARGEIIAFTDDDVCISPTWLQNLTRHLHDPEWAGAGGRILPEQPFVPPGWLSVESRYALAPLAVFDLGSEPGLLAEPPVGANMAFRKEMFEKYGGFRTDLGRRPGSLMSNEDTEFGRRLLAGGERFRYEPSAVVYHPVPEYRLHKKYFLAWWFNKTRADIRELGTPANTRWFFAGIPLVLFRRLAVWTLRWMFALEPATRFSNKINVWSSAGQIKECYHQAAFKRRYNDVPTL